VSALDHFGLALALAALAGLSAYLTAFLLGIAMRLGWFGGVEFEYVGMESLAEPPILLGALVLFLVEFFVDKVPRLDSLWDLPHTLVRPLAGALFVLATLKLGTGGLAETGFVCMGAAVALLVHSTKAGLRLRINTTPEPFSNVGASALENVLVVAGFSLAVQSPSAVVWVIGGVLLLCVLHAPKLWRSNREILKRVWERLRRRQPVLEELEEIS